MKESTRDYNLDFIKFIAIIATISIHVFAPGGGYELGSPSQIFFVCAGSLFRFCVPVFAMASGYLLYTRDEISYKKIWTQVIKFLIYFILAEAFYRFLSCLYMKYYYHNEIDFLIIKEDLLKGNYKDHLYYIFIIIFIYIFAPLGNFILKKEEGQLRYLLGVWMIIPLTITFIINLFNIELLKILRYYELSGAYNFILFALLGGYFNKYKSKIIAKKSLFYIFIFLVSYLLLLVSVFVMSREELNLYAWEGANILNFGLAYSIFGLAMKAKFESERFKNFLKLVSENIFVVYIIHVGFLDFLAMNELIYINFDGPEKVLVCLLEIIGVFIISLLTSIILRFIKKKLNLIFL